MKTYTKEAVLKQYEDSCRIMYEATEVGDYKTNKVPFGDVHFLGAIWGRTFFGIIFLI